MNKYLVKIAEKEINKTRAYGRAALQGTAAGALGGVVGVSYGLPFAMSGSTKIGLGLAGGMAAAAAGLGAYSGYKKSVENQKEEIATRLVKKAQLISNEAKKDIVGTGTIAALGGLGTLAAHKVLPAGAGNGKVFAVGTGIGLAADYVGLKIGQAYNKHVDSKALLAAGKGQVKHASKK